MKALKITADSKKFMGTEPSFANVVLTDANRKMTMLTAFNWYNYNFGAKECHGMVVDYLKDTARTEEATMFKKSADNSIANAYGFLARMAHGGWKLSKDEKADLNKAIAKSIHSVYRVGTIVEDAGDSAAVQQAQKITIQDRMRERTAEAGGDVEGLIDAFIADGCPAKHKLSPINMLKKHNILPGHVASELLHFEAVKAEFHEAWVRKDPDLIEGYGHFTKVQLRNLIKFMDTIISDYSSYTAFKKATKAKPMRKPKTPEQLTRKLKFQRNENDLKLVSDNPTKIIGAKEIFAYNTKTRKLIYIVADDHAGGALSVKNSTIQGFDPTKSIQKTVRKPKEQLKELMAASLPKKRKLVADTKSVEIKFNGRFNENIVILRVV